MPRDRNTIVHIAASLAALARLARLARFARLARLARLGLGLDSFYTFDCIFRLHFRISKVLDELINH